MVIARWRRLSAHIIRVYFSYITCEQWHPGQRTAAAAAVRGAALFSEQLDDTPFKPNQRVACPLFIRRAIQPSLVESVSPRSTNQHGGRTIRHRLCGTRGSWTCTRTQTATATHPQVLHLLEVVVC